MLSYPKTNSEPEKKIEKTRKEDEVGKSKVYNTFVPLNRPFA